MLLGEMKGRSALEEVLAGAGRVSVLAHELKKLEDRLTELSTQTDDDAAMEEMNSVIEKMGELQLEFENRGGYDLESRAKEILTGLGIGPDEYNRSVESFSGGWKMRIELSKILALKPDVLLMDEPTNHMDMETIESLQIGLEKYPGTLIFVSHDREFVSGLANRIVEIQPDGGILDHRGSYDDFLKFKEMRAASAAQ